MTSENLKVTKSEIENLVKNSDASPFAQLLEMKTAKVERGYALATMTMSEGKHLNFNGLAHEAAMCALAIHASSLCSHSIDRNPILSQSSITFFSYPITGTVIEAEARIEHKRKENASLIVDVRTSEGEHLARCQCVVIFSNLEENAVVEY